MVTHNPEYAKQATRSISLFDGRIVDETIRSSPGIEGVA
jgi:ABC-type lipoprotein export system ATPase subunit